MIQLRWLTIAAVALISAGCGSGAGTGTEARDGALGTASQAVNGCLAGQGLISVTLNQDFNGPNTFQIVAVSSGTPEASMISGTFSSERRKTWTATDNNSVPMGIGASTHQACVAPGAYTLQLWEVLVDGGTVNNGVPPSVQQITQVGLASRSVTVTAGQTTSVGADLTQSDNVPNLASFESYWTSWDYGACAADADCPAGTACGGGACRDVGYDTRNCGAADQHCRGYLCCAGGCSDVAVCPPTGTLTVDLTMGFDTPDHVGLVAVAGGTPSAMMGDGGLWNTERQKSWTTIDDYISPQAGTTRTFTKALPVGPYTLQLWDIWGAGGWYDNGTPPNAYYIWQVGAASRTVTITAGGTTHVEGELTQTDNVPANSAFYGSWTSWDYGTCNTTADCPAGTTCGGGFCRDLANDVRDCGSVGYGCGGQLCCSGTCISDTYCPGPTGTLSIDLTTGFDSVDHVGLVVVADGTPAALMGSDPNLWSAENQKSWTTVNDYIALQAGVTQTFTRALPPGSYTIQLWDIWGAGGGWNNGTPPNAYWPWQVGASSRRVTITAGATTHVEAELTQTDQVPANSNFYGSWTSYSYGTCTTTADCPAGTVCGSGTCVDTAYDVRNCGAVGHGCGGLLCCAGSCVTNTSCPVSGGGGSGATITVNLTTQFDSVDHVGVVAVANGTPNALMGRSDALWSAEKQKSWYTLDDYIPIQAGATQTLTAQVPPGSYTLQLWDIWGAGGWYNNGTPPNAYWPWQVGSSSLSVTVAAGGNATLDAVLTQTDNVPSAVAFYGSWTSWDYGPCASSASCPTGAVCVGGVCLDENDDVRNCSGAGQGCGGNLCCGAHCVDVNSDANNCGASGFACQNGATCSGGRCQCSSDYVGDHCETPACPCAQPGGTFLQALSGRRIQCQPGTLRVETIDSSGNVYAAQADRQNLTCDAWNDGGNGLAGWVHMPVTSDQLTACETLITEHTGCAPN